MRTVTFTSFCINIVQQVCLVLGCTKEIYAPENSQTISEAPILESIHRPAIYSFDNFSGNKSCIRNLLAFLTAETGGR